MASFCTGLYRRPTVQTLKIALQKTAAKALGVPQTHVHVHTRRIGGGFGGKEVGPAQLSASLAVAAVKFNSHGS